MSITTQLNAQFSTSFFQAEPLCDAFSQSPALKTICDHLDETHPHLFSPTPIFVSPQDVKTIQALVRLIEKIVKHPAYIGRAIQGLDPVAAFDFGTQGVFYGYDFHMSEEGPKLIEINTNAGGAYLNWVLLEAQKACCNFVEPLMHEPLIHKDLPHKWVEMFKALMPQGHHIAIIDERPEAQYLYPEFLMFAATLEKAGLQVTIADPSDYRFDSQKLTINGKVVDLIYNRLTDFYLTAPQNAAIRQAYRAGAVALTPNPRHHALFAHKRNLITLTDDAALAEFDLTPEEIALLCRTLPKTQAVTYERADDLWQGRNHLFFKPVCGFGSRATYRGDKLTKSVWQNILQGDYVAQALVRPDVRKSAEAALKYDLRAYVNGAEPELLAARLYNGQTTNFRTQGGGFAPVFLSPDIGFENGKCCHSESYAALPKVHNGNGLTC